MGPARKLSGAIYGVMIMAFVNAELVIIGGGPAGLSAAVEARNNGVENIVIFERDKFLGGILNQCIHTGFGLKYFGSELTGPEYAKKLISAVKGMTIYNNTTVMSLDSDLNITAVNAEDGLLSLRPKAVVLAMGSREKPRGALDIGGARPSGIFTAGTAQRLMKMHGKLCGREIVVLGSSDLGLVMARRLHYEGANVKMLIEPKPYIVGLERNYYECIEDNDIPVRLSSKAVYVHGRNRVEGVTVAKVDEKGKVVEGSEERIDCDTLILSAGLVPENDLSRNAGVVIDPVTGGAEVDQFCATSIEGVFSCGNVLHIHDLADNVSDEAEIAGRAAAEFVSGIVRRGHKYRIGFEGNIKYTIPHKIAPAEGRATIYYRVKRPCENAEIRVTCQREVIYYAKVKNLSAAKTESIVIDCGLVNGDVEVKVTVL